MKYQDHFAEALQRARKAKGLTQEDFSSLSSRTYVSTLERGIKSPTLSKINDLAEVLGMHPLTLLALAYSTSKGQTTPERLIAQVERELSAVLSKQFVSTS